MLKRREVLKKNIDKQNFMQYELAELTEWMANDKLENSQFINIPIKINKSKFVDAELILYALNPKNNLTNIHLVTGEVITACINLEFMQDHLEENFNFRMLDNGLLVNMKKLQWYHSNWHRVYFTKDHFISVSGAAIKNIVKDELGKERDLHLSKSKYDAYEYYPLGKTNA